MIPTLLFAPTLLAILLAQAALAQAPPTPVQTARIEGQILNATTGEPLKKANVRLNPNFQAPPNGPAPTAYTISTEADGKFVIEDIAPGTYTLSATRTGFVAQSYGSRAPGMNATPLKLDVGQELKSIAINLTPQAMIYGRVVDEDGEPFAGVNIQAMRWTFSNGKKRLVPSGNGSSQADGTFVMGSLNGGRYFLSAERRDFNMGGVEERSGTKGAGREAYVRTYFPSALDPESAAPIDLAAGSQMRGVEIHLRKARAFEIRGTVVNTVGGPLAQYIGLMLSPKGSSDLMSFNQGNTAQVPPKTGRFLFKNVSPGTYIIRTQYANIETRDSSGEITRIRQLVGRAEVTVGEHDVDNLVLSLGTGIEIPGKFITEGGPQQPPQQPPPSGRTAGQAAPPNDSQPNIYLQVTQGVNYNSTFAQANDDGSFRLRGIEPDVFTVNINGFPDGSYVKSIKFGGQDITGKELDLSSGAGGELEILISPNAADVSGTVRNADGQPVASARVQVCDKDKKMAGAATTDQNGSFHITKLAPGEYQVFAWESTGEGVITDPDFRKAFDSQASIIKLSEKSHENVDAKLIGLAAMEVELAKIR
jgi:uncharacterized surface anchored protein